MSADKQETLADISALFRTYAKATRDVKVKTIGFDPESLDEIADRIDAAWERQRAEWEGKTLRELSISREELRAEYRKIYGIAEK